MKIFYIPNAGIGELFYDSKSHEGIAIDSNGRAAIQNMERRYNPRTKPGCIEFEVDQSAFTHLRQAAERYLDGDESASTAIQEALEPFPRVKIPSPEDSSKAKT